MIYERKREEFYGSFAFGVNRLKQRCLTLIQNDELREDAELRGMTKKDLVELEQQLEKMEGFLYNDPKPA